MMDTFIVNVSIDGRSIRVDKPRVEMTGLDCLQWKGNEAFTIQFDDPAPFGAKLNHAQAQALNKPRPGYEKSKKYKYTVICDRDPSIKLDPIVIVDPGPSGGH